MKRLLKPTVECDLNQIDISQFSCVKDLQKEFAQTYGIKKSQIELFNGCENIIETFFINVVHKQKISKCYIYAPCFSYYSQLAHTFCTQVIYINRFEEIDREIDENSLVIFTNPAKPDGLYYDLEELFEQWKEKSAIILLDEAFIDFTNQKSIAEKLESYNQLYIIKSMQRFFNTQGLKISVLISETKNIKHIQRSLPKHRLSILDTHYLQKVFKDKSFKSIHQAVTIKNMMLLEEVLKCTGLFETIYPTNTNMLLCKLKNMEAKKFIKTFSQAQLYMKTCESFKFLDKYHVRFTVYSEEDIRSLVETFQKVYIS